MQINSVQNKSFGQIYVSPEMQQKIKKTIDTAQDENYPTKNTFKRNWNRCLNSTQFDILIEDDGKVFLLDKKGQKVMEETLLSTAIWNIDTALKRVLLFEDAAPNTYQKISKYS